MVLNALHANVLICGGMSGSADEAVAAFVAGNLDCNPNVCYNHHGAHHSEGHICGDHGCGGHCGAHQ